MVPGFWVLGSNRIFGFAMGFLILTYGVDVVIRDRDIRRVLA